MVTWEIESSLLVLTTAGFGGRETLFALSQVVADPAFRPGRALLCDLRLEIDDPSCEEMASRAKFIAGLLPLGVSRRCALVMPWFAATTSAMCWSVVVSSHAT